MSDPITDFIVATAPAPITNREIVGGRRPRGKVRFADTESRAPADGGASSSTAALDAVSTTTSECAEHVAGAGGVCSAPATIQAITAFVREVGPSESSARGTDALAQVEAAAAVLNCTSESCVVNHPTFRQYLELKNPKIASEVAHDSERRFKARGPRSSRALLSNFNIDQTLQRWAAVFPDFYNCSFAMMDFARTREPLARVSLPDVYLGNESQDLGSAGGRLTRPCRTFACVVNTDDSSGGGKHWVELFVDMRGMKDEPWTTEYFNSAGNPPPTAILKWMAQTEDDLRELRSSTAAPAGSVMTVPVTDVAHQRTRTECGLYTLFYVRARLEGEPFAYFAEDRVPDEAMVAFREHVFRSTS